ncbi:hypothetical protein QBC43DRAFT_67617 [Cladorrhinum sp. PSN259]|nr:hypothetical protein QBC43DRAFT_67617 [Cladorrhinum sp. PSN259]
MAAPQQVSPVQETFLHDDSDTASEAGSESPSVMYQAEPFDTFKTRIHELTLTQIWPNANSDQITIERLRSSGFNRIIGITWDVDNHKLQHVVRVPWFPDDDLAAQAAPLDLIKKHTKIPCAKIIQYDLSTENPLESPYMIQDHVPGVDLHSLMHNQETGKVDNKISHHGWQKLARELGSITRQMLSTRSTVAGTIVLSPDRAKSLHIAPFPTTTSDSASTTSRPYISCVQSEITPSRISDLLTSLFTFEREKELAEGTRADLPSPWPHLITLTSELYSQGHFQNLNYALCHPDLLPRNILVSPQFLSGTRSSTKSSIAAILDWDSALLAPSFMACRPPAWLWNHGEEYEVAQSNEADESERNTKVEPNTREGEIIKQIFDEAAGEEYVRLAYDPVYVLLRQLFKFAIGGVNNSDQLELARRLVEEWEEIKRGKNLKEGDDEGADEAENGLLSPITEQPSAQESPHQIRTQTQSEGEKKGKVAKIWKKRCVVM